MQRLLRIPSARQMSTKASVVTIGIGADHPAIPDELRDNLKKSLDEAVDLMQKDGYTDFEILP